MDKSKLFDSILEQATKSCRTAIHKEYKEQIARLTKENKTLHGELDKTLKHGNKFEEKCCLYEQYMGDIKQRYRVIVEEGRSAEVALGELKLLIATKKKEKGVK